MFPLDPSDVLLLADFALSIVLVGVFSLGRPRTWVADPLGWVIFYCGLSVVALLGLIVWGIVFGQKIDEPARFLVSFALGIGFVWNTHQIALERARGRLAGERSTPIGRKTMSTKNLTVADLESATTIWYKAQRVARTAVATLITMLSGWATFIGIFPDISAQLAKVLPGDWIVWIGGSVAGVTVVASAITGIMAIPVVNAFLTKWLNLGSVPKRAIAVDPIAATLDDSGVHIIPDPKDASRIGAEPSPIGGEARG